MDKEKNNGTSKRKKVKQKEVKLTAAERRRLQREKERGEETRFSAFETDHVNSKPKRSSPTDQQRFSNFDVSSNVSEEKDDYFDRLYGGTPGESSRERKLSRHNSSKTNDDNPENDEYLDKSYKIKELTKKQRRFRTFLSYSVVFIIIVILAVFLSLTVMFKTTEIIVKGENLPYSQEDIINTSGLKYSENIFLAKRKAAVKKIVDSYPYIENAEVSFRIPGTQIITVETAVPSYQVSVSEGFAVVSAKGRVLEIVKTQRANIPLLKGLKLTDSREGQYISFEKNTTQQILNEVINNINENEVPNIYGVDISNSANIKLNYDNRITIMLGVPEEVGYKLRTAMAIINNELSATDKGDLDVSLASSDRKSSYFTPVYTNTINIDGGNTVSGTSSESTAPTIKSADEYLKDNSSKTGKENESLADNYDYINDIIEDDIYEYESVVSEDENSSESVNDDKEPNIISDYGTNYNY